MVTFKCFFRTELNQGTKSYLSGEELEEGGMVGCGSYSQWVFLIHLPVGDEGTGISMLELYSCNWLLQMKHTWDGLTMAG